MTKNWRVLQFKGGKPEVLGYARVSTDAQNLEGQLDVLEREGCSRVWAEKVSSTDARPGWQSLLEQVRPGDTVVVARLDRIGRRLVEIVRTVTELSEQGVRVRAVHQGVDTGQPAGKIVVALFAALAESERETLSERTKEGLAAARARGRRGGRPWVRTEAKMQLVQTLAANGYKPGEIATATKIGESTIRRMLRDQKEPPKQVALGLEEPPRKSPTESTPRGRRARKAKTA